MMINGEFREDLYYRLKVIEVTVPPLRERRMEISHLTGFFIDRYARRYNRPVRQLSETLAQLFQTYDWPGNIRELENMIKRIVILQDESLVVREMTRVGRPHAAYAVAGVGAGVAASPSRVAPLPDAPDEPEVDDDLLLDDCAGRAGGWIQAGGRREVGVDQGGARADRRDTQQRPLEPPPRG